MTFCSGRRNCPGLIIFFIFVMDEQNKLMEREICAQIIILFFMRDSYNGSINLDHE